MPLNNLYSLFLAIYYRYLNCHEDLIMFYNNVAQQCLFFPIRNDLPSFRDFWVSAVAIQKIEDCRNWWCLFGFTQVGFMYNSCWTITQSFNCHPILVAGIFLMSVFLLPRKISVKPIYSHIGQEPLCTLQGAPEPFRGTKSRCEHGLIQQHQIGWSLCTEELQDLPCLSSLYYVLYFLCLEQGKIAII